MKTASEYAAHVAALCRAFNIALVIRQGMDPAGAGAGFLVRAGVRTTQLSILIAPITDETTYAAAMHELGHCLSAFGMLRHAHGSIEARTGNIIATQRDACLQYEEEVAAWAWARHHALDWTVAMQQLEIMMMRGYSNFLRQATGRRMTYTPGDLKP